MKSVLRNEQSITENFKVKTLVCIYQLINEKREKRIRYEIRTKKGKRGVELIKTTKNSTLRRIFKLQNCKMNAYEFLIFHCFSNKD